MSLVDDVRLFVPLPPPHFFSSGVHVPVVLLMLEGGENTLATAAEAIDRNTPVVVIAGSGRCADLIAYAYRVTKHKE